MKKKMKETPSYSSPKGGSRGCLCKDGKTYSSKCCNGAMRAQGVGKIHLVGQDSSGTINAQDTTNTVSSTSTDVPSLGSSTITVIDTTNTVVNSSSTAIISMAVTPGTYEVGDALPLVATFNEEVTVETTEGTPTVDVSIDENTRQFSYTEGSGTEDLTFEYTLVEEDADFQTVEVATDIELNGAVITDAGGDPVETTTESIEVVIENVTPPSVVITTPEIIPDVNISTFYRYPKKIADINGNAVVDSYNFLTANEINTYHDTTYYATGTQFFSFGVDTDTVEVGSFLYVPSSTSYTFDENDSHVSYSSNYTAWADLPDVNYTPLKANSGDYIDGGNWNLYPIYKFEKIDGYLRCTEIITSGPI